MGNNRIHIPHKAITPIQQSILITSRFSDFKAQKISGGYAWKGTLQPTSLSRIYEVKIEFTAGSRPRVYLIAPKLVIKNGQRPPHIYSEDRPCIYFPFGANADWNDQKHIANTIIPWYSLWLYYYEIWLATDVWLGEGIHLANKTHKKEDDNL